MSINCSSCNHPFTKQKHKPINILPCKHISCLNCIQDSQQKASDTPICPKCKNPYVEYVESHIISPEYLEDDEQPVPEPVLHKPDRFIFLSYAWGEKVNDTRPNQDLIKLVRGKLVAEGFKVWMDIFKLGMGNLYENLQNAINSSIVIICFINDAYIESENCRMEFFYARELASYYEKENKKNPQLKRKLTVIPIFLKSYSVVELKHGIGFVLNSSLRINAYPNWTEQTDELLLKYIRENTSELVVPINASEMWQELESSVEKNTVNEVEEKPGEVSLTGENDVFILYSKSQEVIIPNIREKLQQDSQRKLKIVHQEDKRDPLLSASSTSMKSLSDEQTNLANTIDDSKVVLYFINEDSIQSPSYMNAIKYAKNKNKKTNSVIFGDVDLSSLPNGNGILVSSVEKIELENQNDVNELADSVASKIGIDLDEIDRKIKELNELKLLIQSKEPVKETSTKQVVPSPKKEKILQGHKDTVNVLIMAPDGQLISGSSDFTIKFWDIEQETCTRTLTGHKGNVNALAITNSGELASGSNDKSIKVWSLKRYECITTIVAHVVNVLLPVQFKSPAENTIASSSIDCTIKIFNLDKGDCLYVLKGFSGSVKSLAINPAKPEQLISGSGDHTIKIWDLSVGKCIKTLSGHNGDIRGLAVNDKGQLISVSGDWTAKVWDLESGECLMTLSVHKGAIRAIVVDTQGNCISCSADKTIKVFDSLTGNVDNRAMQGHKDWVNALVLADEKTLLSGSNDKTIRIWSIDKYKKKESISN